MVLARKGTRRIVVDGVAFRWTVSPDDEPGVALVAELDSVPASCVVVWFPHGILISPGVVAEEIRVALLNDWHPERRGPDVVRQAIGNAPAIEQKPGNA
jgi:hypothetical protein